MLGRSHRTYQSSHLSFTGRCQRTSVLYNLQPLDIVELKRHFKAAKNKTCGLDPCPTSLLKGTLDTHLLAVLDLFCASLQQGVFSDIFKTADVIPVLKKPGADDQLLSNYRPVSNLPFLSKLLERVVVERLLEHIDQLDIHETFQSAYRPHHSTETALLRVHKNFLGVQDDIASVLDKNRGVML